MAGTDSIVEFGSLDSFTRAIAVGVGALRRRRNSIALITLLFVGIGCAAAAILPRTYVVEASLLVTRQPVMPALANPRRTVPPGSEVPIQAAVASVLSRSSLEGIIRANDLLERWDRERPAVLRLKDRVLTWVKGPISADDKIDAIINVLAKRIWVTVNADIVTVKATWADGRSALDIVNSAVEAFLDTRRKVDVESIEDTYRILERTAEERMADLTRKQVDLGVAVAAGAARVPEMPRTTLLEMRAPAAGLGAHRDDGLGELRARVLAVRRIRGEIEKRHQAKVTELEVRMAELRGSQTDRHPDMVALRRALDRLSEEPDELKEARDKEARLLAEYVAKGGRPGGLAAKDLEDGSAREAALTRVPLDPRGPTARSRAEEEPEAVVYARSRFKGSLESYQDLVARLGDVRIELETAKSAFGYRYSVTQPARLPKRASSPNVPLVIIGAVLAGLSAGVLRVVFSELRAASLLSPAAVARHLRLQVSGPRTA